MTASQATLFRISESVCNILGTVPVIARRLAPPLLRITLALPFLRSGLTRWDGFLSISPTTIFLFEEQFKLHFLGAAYSLPFPDQIALVTAICEIMLPLLLLIGAATRLAALGLLVMTGIIQLVFPDGWVNFHLYWAAIAVGIIGSGAGSLSIDHWIGRRVHGLPPERGAGEGLQ
jgi:putative oxidoreductase